VSRPARSSTIARACEECLRRSWLLGELGAVLDCNCRDDGRLLDLLELDDRELIAALGGRRRAQLSEAHASFSRDRVVSADGAVEVCRHGDDYPPLLRSSAAATMLNVAGGAAPCVRLRALTAQPVVAFVGLGASSDYGSNVAWNLARGLAASGVTVAAAPSGAIEAAALAGAIERDAGAIAVIGGGLDVGTPVRRRSLCRRLTRTGCAVSELGAAVTRRRWSAVGCERVAALLANVAVVVEADDSARALAGARVARRHERAVAAVPGRITSRGARGAHALLRDGARLVTSAADVLELICEADGPASIERSRASPRVDVEPHLQRVLELIGDGCDTPGRLLGAGGGAGELLRSLGELELLGLIARGDGDRYVATDPLAPPAARYGVSDQMEP
jgi:DNA processing protein